MDSSAQVSVTQWLADLKDGQETLAQQQVWNRYFERLTHFARKQLAGAPRTCEDEEDVVLSALGSFFAGMQQGKFPELADRQGLWPLLARITACKAVNQYKRQTAAKRGGGKVVAASALPRSADDSLAVELIDDALTPATLVELNEQCQVLLNLLPDPISQQIAKLRLAGHSTNEIAETVGLAPRSVERKAALIRDLWSDYAVRQAADA